MIGKTIIAATLMAGLASGSVMAAAQPMVKKTTTHSMSTKHGKTMRHMTRTKSSSSGTSEQRDATRKLNEQQLSASGGMPGGMSGANMGRMSEMKPGTAPMADQAGGPEPMAPMDPAAPGGSMTPQSPTMPPAGNAPPQ